MMLQISILIREKLRLVSTACPKRWFCLLAALFFLPLAAQDGVTEWEQQIARFEEGGEPDSLAYYYHKKAAYYRQADSLAEWAYCYWDWQATVFEDSPLALAILDTAVQQAWRLPGTAEEAEAMLWVQTNRGYHLFQLGKVLASVKAYEAALTWLQTYPDIAFEALEYLFLPLGAHYTRLGDNERARALYETAISRHVGGEQAGELAGLYNNLGLAFWNDGDYARAIAVYEKGLACQDVPAIKAALLRLSLAQSYLDSGSIAAAQEMADTALAMLRQIQAVEPDTEGIDDYLSGACLLQARLVGEAGALAYLRQALALGTAARATGQHRDIAKIWLEFGRLHLRSGAPRQAQEAFNQALASLIPGFPADSLDALPRPEQLYEENALYQALEGKADALLAQYQEPEQLPWLQSALECHQLAGQVEAKLRRSLQYESSKISLAAQSRQRLGKAIDIARQLYKATGEEAFLYHAWSCAEQAKSALLLEAVQRHRFSGLLEGDDALLISARQLRQQTAYFERSLLLSPDSPLRAEWLSQRDSLLQQLAAAEEGLAQRHPAWAAWQEQAARFSGDDIRRLQELMPDYTLLEYFVGEKQIELFCQPPGGQASWVRIAQPDSLAARVQHLRALLQSRTALQAPAAYEELAYSVYRQGLLPALAALPTETPNLLIVPDTWLAFLPFEALLHDASPGEGWGQMPFLLRRHGIHYAFSLAVLDSQRRLPSRANRNLLQLAPRFAERQRGLPPLVYSHEEAPANLACRSRRCLDGQASFEQLQKAAVDYRILHLSTHAGVDAGGLLPQVEFYDRPAYLPDIYALQLQADLVVLSACQTAQGQFREGEGVMSLSRAFAYAGAKGLAASLWAINETATADLCRRMYAHLRAGAAKPAALRLAKLDYLAAPEVPAFQKSPYYWSGLVYLGDEAAMSWAGCLLSDWALVLLVLLAGGTVAAGGWWWWRRKKIGSPSF